MELRTYQAGSMHEALALVRRELGPDAAVLHTRQVRERWWGLWPRKRKFEVTASRGITVPSRLSASAVKESVASAPVRSEPPRLDRQMQSQLSHLQSMVKDLCRHSKGRDRGDWPEDLFHMFTELLDAEVNEDLARELVDRLRDDPGASGNADPLMLKARVAGMIEDDVRIGGPIQITPGRCRLAALVGPTGVGKTTTIAKLAANFRLKEKQRVGLITVDTYRIAAIEQLRTYADIIDLPMHVVSTPREMRETVERMSHLDLILLDTAEPQPQGRNPASRVEDVLDRGGGRRGAFGSQQRCRAADARTDGRAVHGHRRHVVDLDEARRGHRAWERVAGGTFEWSAAQLFDRRTKCSRRH